MIYDPVTRQSLEFVGRYPQQDHYVRFGKVVKGLAKFAKVRYGEYLPGFSGGFAIGEERDYHQMVLTGGQWPFGFQSRLVSEDNRDGVQQRPFEPDQRPSDLSSVSFEQMRAVYEAGG